MLVSFKNLWEIKYWQRKGWYAITANLKTNTVDITKAKQNGSCKKRNLLSTEPPKKDSKKTESSTDKIRKEIFYIVSLRTFKNLEENEGHWQLQLQTWKRRSEAKLWWGSEWTEANNLLSRKIFHTFVKDNLCQD